MTYGFPSNIFMIPGSIGGNSNWEEFDLFNDLCNVVVYGICYLEISIRYICSHHNIINNRVKERLERQISYRSIPSRQNTLSVFNGDQDTLKDRKSALRQGSLNNIPEIITLQHLLLEKNDRIDELEAMIVKDRMKKKMSIKNLKSIFK